MSDRTSITITTTIGADDIMKEPDLLLQAQIRQLCSLSYVEPQVKVDILQYEADRIKASQAAEVNS